MSLKNTHLLLYEEKPRGRVKKNLSTLSRIA